MQFANVSLDFIVFANIIDDLALALNSQRERKKRYYGKNRWKFLTSPFSVCDDDALVLVFSFKSCSIPISIEISRYELLPRHEPLLPIFLRPHAVQITYKDQCCQLFQNQKMQGWGCTVFKLREFSQFTLTLLWQKFRESNSSTKE